MRWMHRYLVLGALTLASSLVSADATRAAAGSATNVATNVARAFSCAPVITSVSASSGTEAGGTSVTINGRCFTGSTGATIASHACTGFSVTNDSAVACTTPAYTSALSSTAADNLVTVTVTNPDGIGSLAAFTYTSELKNQSGSLYSNEYRANDPRITLNGSTVSGWPDYNGDCALAQATASLQPTYSASSFNSGPGITGDGSNDVIKCTKTSSIGSGKRPYIMVAFARVGGTGRIAAISDATEATDYLSPKMGATNFRAWRGDSSGFQDVNSTTVLDTNRHLSEVGDTASGTNSLVVDGTGNNSTATGSVSGSITSIAAFNAFPGGGPGNSTVAAILVLNDAPDATTLSNLRTAFKTSIVWSGGYASNSLGLP